MCPLRVSHTFRERESIELWYFSHLLSKRPSDRLQANGDPDPASLTATKKSAPKSPAAGQSTPPSSAKVLSQQQQHPGPQPVPASYATASTPSQPTSTCR
ncbi:hypothetical protein WMY93_024612 [Mugilogobius chulae]|uniref:Uncharacterized protein n=1 Tax=Mugilogobius chulae TaxID=88201 RepID=A0AAW0N4M7_9GOBI